MSVGMTEQQAVAEAAKYLEYFRRWAVGAARHGRLRPDDIDDAIQEMYFVAIRCLMRYDPSKGDVLHYLCKSTRDAVQRTRKFNTPCATVLLPPPKPQEPPRHITLPPLGQNEELVQMWRRCRDLPTTAKALGVEYSTLKNRWANVQQHLRASFKGTDNADSTNHRHRPREHRPDLGLSRGGSGGRSPVGLGR